MMRRLPLAIGILILAMLVAGLLLWTGEPRPPSLTLADGSILTLEAFTVGTNQEFRTESRLRSRMRDALPRLLKPILGAPGYARTETTTDGRAHLWFSLFDPVTGKYRSPDLQGIHVVDPSGQVYTLNSSSSGGNNTFKERHFDVRVFPRRAPEFLVRFRYQQNPYELTVRNPGAGQTYPVWTPRSLPQTHKTNGFAFTLEGLELHSHRTNRYYCTPSFKVAQDGVDRSAWWNPQTTFADATGNAYYNALPVLEPAWKLEVNFFRTAQFPFEPGVAFPLGRFKAPKPGAFIALELDPSLVETGLTFAAFFGPGRYTLRNGVVESAQPWQEGLGGGSSSTGSGDWTWTFSNEEARFVCVLRGPSSGKALLHPQNTSNRRLLVRAQAGDGTWHDVSSSGSSSSDDGTTLMRLHKFQIRDADPGREYQLDVLSDTAIALEYLVAPPALAP